MYCQQCGTENPGEAKFCRSCGFHLLVPAEKPDPVAVTKTKVKKVAKPIIEEVKPKVDGVKTETVKNKAKQGSDFNWSHFLEALAVIAFLIWIFASNC